MTVHFFNQAAQSVTMMNSKPGITVLRADSIFGTAC